MTKKEVTKFLYSVIHEIILYPSLGTLPYTIIVYTDEEINAQPNFKMKVSHYIAVYLWDRFDKADLLDYFSNSREAQGMDKQNRKSYIEVMMHKYEDLEEYKFWLSRQVAMVTGILTGRIRNGFKIDIANPDELTMMERDVLPQKRDMSLVSVIYVQP